MTAGREGGEIHLGDLVRALATLPWRGRDQVATIAACLGFRLGAQSPESPSTTPHRVFDRRGTETLSQARRVPAPQPPVFHLPRSARPAPLPEGTLPGRLIRLSDLAPPQHDPPDWLAESASAYNRYQEPPLARATLLPERTARHILSAALATPRAGGAIDVPRLVAAICGRKPLRELPRIPETSLNLGCQLLLDYSGPMVPFWEDLNGLTAQVCDVVGEQATRVYSFDTKPTEARHWPPTGEPEFWKPDGRPVLAATDLGIQGRSQAEPNPDWTDLAAKCGEAASLLILLTPWPQDRWPRTFPANVTLVHWGPRTTAGMVHWQAAAIKTARKARLGR